MSFHRFLTDLQELKSDLQRQHDENENHVLYGSHSLSSKPLDELLEDLTDYSRAHGDHYLTQKLENLQSDKEDRLGYSREKEFPALMARTTRVIRALETFGRKYLQDELAVSQEPKPSTNEEPEQVDLDSVFVVHGHDNATLFRVKETLAVLGLKPLVLREQPNGGKTIIEKFELYSNVGFAVVLMTADDMGGSLKQVEAGDQSARARQNVIMELGFFASKLGRSRICVLKDGSVEAPSDIMGVVYTPIDDGEAWRLALAKELKNAGYAIDLNLL